MSAKSVSTPIKFFKTLSKLAADNAPSNKELKTKKAEKEKRAKAYAKKRAIELKEIAKLAKIAEKEKIKTEKLAIAKVKNKIRKYILL